MNSCVKRIYAVLLICALSLSSPTSPCISQEIQKSEWKKYDANPVLGGDLGVCFDVALLREDGLFKMWFSWRTKESIGYTESADGINWSEPLVVLAPCQTGWEERINRCSVLHKGDLYYMWYTGQTNDRSQIGFATSPDGIHWDRRSSEPIMTPQQEWEKVAVMCPDVSWDEEAQLFKMYYSAGEQNEPNSIGFATSPDGITWSKEVGNPIFMPDKNFQWEQHKTTAAQVIKRGEWFYMFYIGFENESLARIGLARSKDGLHNWERNRNNPIVSPDEGSWDADACYKPFAIYDEESNLWRLWYNGRTQYVEQIGLILRQGEDLDFE